VYCSMSGMYSSEVSKLSTSSFVDAGRGAECYSQWSGVLCQDHEEGVLQRERHVLIGSVQAGHELPLKGWQGIRPPGALSAHFGIDPPCPQKLHLHRGHPTLTLYSEYTSMCRPAVSFHYETVRLHGAC